MESILYNVMNGAKTGFTRQTLIGNNLANTNTPGFKADLYAAQSMYLQGTGIGNVAMPVQNANQYNLSPGAIIPTGRDLDVAIEGNGWFAIQDSSGKEAYTQSGNFQITQNGRLVTGSGQPVIGDGGPISIPPAQRVEIGTDGTISVVPLDGNPDTLAVIDRLKLVKLEGKDIRKTEEGLFRPANGGAVQPDASLSVVTGAINGSNANPIEQMVLMIEANREYEQNMKLMQNVDDNHNRLTQLLRD